MYKCKEQFTRIYRIGINCDHNSNNKFAFPPADQKIDSDQ